MVDLSLEGSLSFLILRFGNRFVSVLRELLGGSGGARGSTALRREVFDEGVFESEELIHCCYLCLPVTKNFVVNFAVNFGSSRRFRMCPDSRDIQVCKEVLGKYVLCCSKLVKSRYQAEVKNVSSRILQVIEDVD